MYINAFQVFFSCFTVALFLRCALLHYFTATIFIIWNFLSCAVVFIVNIFTVPGVFVFLVWFDWWSKPYFFVWKQFIILKPKDDLRSFYSFLMFWQELRFNCSALSVYNTGGVWKVYGVPCRQIWMNEHIKTWHQKEIQILMFWQMKRLNVWFNPINEQNKAKLRACRDKVTDLYLW